MLDVGIQWRSHGPSANAGCCAHKIPALHGRHGTAKISLPRSVLLFKIRPRRLTFLLNNLGRANELWTVSYMPAQPYWQSAGECGGEGWVEEGRDEKVSGLSYCFEE